MPKQRIHNMNLLLLKLFSYLPADYNALLKLSLPLARCSKIKNPFSIGLKKTRDHCDNDLSFFVQLYNPDFSNRYFVSGSDSPPVLNLELEPQVFRIIGIFQRPWSQVSTKADDLAFSSHPNKTLFVFRPANCRGLRHPGWKLRAEFLPGSPG